MGMLGSLRRIAERLTGTRILRHLPRGIDVFYDLAHALPQYRLRTIFDVGSNVGQSADRFLARAPEAELYCFEPITASYRLLAEAYGNNPRVHCFQLAFGADAGRGTMSSEGTLRVNRLLPHNAVSEAATEEVRVEMLDGFCRQQAIEHIDYLKIDAEGSDLKVLEGGVAMLTEQAVDVVEVEAGMHPDNHDHVPLEQLKGHLELRGYYLLALYEQVPEQERRAARLRRSNAVFLSQSLMTRYSQ